MKGGTVIPIALAVFILLARPAGPAWAEQDKKPDAGAKQGPCIEDEEKYDLAVDEALTRLKKAELLHKEKKKEEAVKELLKVVEIAFCPSKNADGFQLRLIAVATCGQIYVELKKGKEAEELLKKGLDMAPALSKEAASLYATIARAYEIQGKSKEALAASDHALAILEKLKEGEKKDGKKD